MKPIKILIMMVSKKIKKNKKLKTKMNVNQTTNSDFESDLKIFYDIHSPECKNLIETAIEKNGFAPEHNYDCFISYACDDSKLVFVYFGENRGLFAYHWDNQVWQIISEIMAPEKERADIFMEFANYIFNKKSGKKIFVEFAIPLRKEIMKKVQKLYPFECAMNNEIDKKKIVVGDNIDKTTTPIILLEKWDPKLEGADFSKLRKAKGRFFRNFSVEIIKGKDVLDVPFEEFKTLVSDWKKLRKCKDTAYDEDYVNYFKNGFKGSAANLVLKLNGKVCAVASAWVIPNTNGKTVYYGISLHNYSVSELGDFLNVLFFDELKLLGFEYVDFGTSDEALLKYKEKFGPVKYYELVDFYVRYESEEDRLKKKSIKEQRPGIIL